MRGLGGNASSRALILLDGVPQIDPFGGWVSWPRSIRGGSGCVRVTRGGGSGATGPGALAGTIELDERRAGAGGAVSAGSHMAAATRSMRDAGSPAHSASGFASISASYARGDGFMPIVAGNAGRPISPRATNKRASARAR